MPNDNQATNAALINYAGQVTSAAAGAMAQNKLNKKTMRYNDEWAYRQREWALQDWKMQNEYNSPIEQRKRMIAANMNPALMYGSGASGGASSPVRTNQSPSWNPQVPKVDLGAGASIMTYIGVQKQQAELEQMRLQNELLKERTTTQKAVTKLTWDKSRLTQTQNDQLQQIVSAVQEYAIENPRADGIQGNYNVEKYKSEIDMRNQQIIISAAENVRRENRNNVSMNLILAQTVHEYTKNLKDEAEIKRINAQVELIQKSGMLLQFDIDAQEILNRRLDGPAGTVLKAIIQKLLPSK